MQYIAFAGSVGLLFGFAALEAFAQDDDSLGPPVIYPKLAAHAASAEAFVPHGWRLEFKRTGDLNADGKPDLLLVLKDADPKNIIDNTAMGPKRFDTNPRILAVAFASAKGGYDLALENHTLVPRPDSPTQDDYLDPKAQMPNGVSIARGSIHVKLGFWSSAGSWSSGWKAYTFRFKNGKWELIGFDFNTTGRSSGEIETASIDYLSGRVRRDVSTMETDAPPKTTWADWPKKPLLTIERVGSGAEFQPLPEMQ